MIKTPITYYGGKQKLLSYIVPLIPKHNFYVEPFIGGGAILFAKPPSKVEVINDIKNEVVTFYEVLKNDFNALDKMVQTSLHSESQFNHALAVQKYPHFFGKVTRTRAFWFLCLLSFGCLNKKLWLSFDDHQTKNLTNKKIRFMEDLKNKLENIQIECKDAKKVIKARDSKNTFFYLNPPYVNTEQGIYEGYTIYEYNELLKLLESLSGRFILSGFRNTFLK